MRLSIGTGHSSRSNTFNVRRATASAPRYRTLVDCHDVRVAVTAGDGSIESGIRIGAMGAVASEGAVDVAEFGP
jgi:hypothetical protein